MIWVLLYGVGAVAMLRSAVRYAATKDDYAWDMDDIHDVFFLAFFSLISAVLWPLTLLLGIGMALVKRAYARAEADA